MADNGLQLIDGLVTHVIDPSNFFLRLGQDEHIKSFNEFESYLNSYCQHASPVEVENISIGSNVLAKSSKKSRRGDNQWRRAIVFRVDREKDKYDVFYEDYGNSENVDVRSIITTLPSDIFSFPHICVPCGLAGIMPLAVSWTSRGIKTFEQLVKGKKFKVIIHTFDQSRMHRTVAMYHDSGKSLVHELLEAEVGLPTGEDVKTHLNEIPSDFFTEDTEAGYLSTQGFGTSSADGKEEPALQLANPFLCSQSYVWGMPGSVGCHSNSESPLANILQNVGTPGPSWHTRSLVEGFGMSDCEEVARCLPDVAENSLFQISESNEDEKSGHEKMAEEESTKYDHENKASHPKRLSEAEVCAFGEQNNCDMEAAVVTELGSAQDSKWEVESMVSPDDVVVPGFNLSILKRGVLSAAELQEKQDAAEMARRKAQLLHDLDFCHQESEHHAAHIGDQLSCKQEDSHNNTDMFDRISEQIHSFHGDSRTDSSDKDNLVLKDQESEGGESRFSNSSPVNREGEESEEFSLKADSEEKVALQEDTAEAESSVGVSKDKSTSDVEGKPDTAFPKVQKLEVPLEKHTVSEEEEYQLQKQFQMILHEIEHGEDFQVVCARLFSLVPTDTEHILTVVQVLVEEAIKRCKLTDSALEILGSYINVLNGPSLLIVLRQSAEKFVKLPIAKNQPYHVLFSEFLARIVTAACCWPPILRNEVLEFAKQCLEKWVIFNKKGTQKGAIPKRLEAMYVECAEAFLGMAYPVLEDDDGYMNFLFNEMRSKVLEGEADYAIRSRLLELLLQLAGSRPQTQHSLETCGTQTSAVVLMPVTSKTEMVDKATMTEQAENLPCGSSAHFSLPLESASSQALQKGAKLLGSCSSYSDSLPTSSLSSQCDGSGQSHSEASEGADDNTERTTDVWAQSESSTGCKGRNTVMSHGRARRRQILIDHLQGKVSAATSHSGSPEISPSISNLASSWFENSEHSDIVANIVSKPEQTLALEPSSSSVIGIPVDIDYDQHHDVWMPDHFDDETTSIMLEQHSVLPPTDKTSCTVDCSPCREVSLTIASGSSQPKSASVARCSSVQSSDRDFLPLCASLPYLLKDSISPTQNQDSLRSIVSDIFGKSVSEMQQQTGNCASPSRVSILGEEDSTLMSLSPTTSPETTRTVDVNQDGCVPSDLECWLSSAEDETSSSVGMIGSPRDGLKTGAQCNKLRASSTAKNEDCQRPYRDFIQEAGDGAVQVQSRQILPGESGDVRSRPSQDDGTHAGDPDDWEDVDESWDKSRPMEVLTGASEMERGKECQQPQTPEKNETKSSEGGGETKMETSPQRPTTLYEMGDLAKFATDSKAGPKKKKTKFRPFHYSTTPLHLEDVSNLAKWVPGEVMCTNCGAKGHLRYDCTKPSKSILL